MPRFHSPELVLFAALLLGCQSAHASPRASHGETSDYASDNTELLDDSFKIIAQGEVPGLPDRVLVVHVSVTLKVDAQSGPLPSVFGIQLTAGGFSLLAGGDSEQRTSCPSTGSLCDLSLTGWLDLDQAETGNPGNIYGKPIVVTLTAAEATANTGPFARIHVSMSMHLENKLAVLSAAVDDNGKLSDGFGAAGASRKGKGKYNVRFDRRVTGCTYAASQRGKQSGQANIRRIAASKLEVRTTDGQGKPANRAFNVHVDCQ